MYQMGRNKMIYICWQQVFCLENPMDVIRVAEYINEFSKSVDCTVNIQKPVIFSKEQLEFEIKKYHLSLFKKWTRYKLNKNNVQVTNAKNCKTLIREIKEYLSTWRYTPCILLRGLNIGKMLVILNLVYKFNVIPTKPRENQYFLGIIMLIL